MTALAIDRSLAVARAKTWENLGEYKLGRGHGDNPAAPSPLEGGYCDCSNFVHWCLGSVLDRSADGGPYLNTDGIILDAYGRTRGGGKVEARQRVFARAAGPAEPGDLLVNPGVYALNDAGQLRRRRPGHVGIIVEVRPGYRRDLPLVEVYHLLRVVHCSTFGTGEPPAIRETSAAPFRLRGYLCRYKGFALEADRWA